MTPFIIVIMSKGHDFVQQLGVSHTIPVRVGHSLLTFRCTLDFRHVRIHGPTMDCEKVYIVEMERSLTERVREHKYAVKRDIATHAWTAQHRVDWSAAKVRTTEQHLYIYGRGRC